MNIAGLIKVFALSSLPCFYLSQHQSNVTRHNVTRHNVEISTCVCQQQYLSSTSTLNIDYLCAMRTSSTCISIQLDRTTVSEHSESAE